MKHIKRIFSLVIIALFSLLVFKPLTKVDASIQTSINRMDNLPSISNDYVYTDWKDVTIQYINYILDPNGAYTGKNYKGDDVNIKIARDTLSKEMDTYFGTTGSSFWSVKSYLGFDESGSGEGICCIAAILSASACGLDMTSYKATDSSTPRNYVKEMVAYYSVTSGENIIVNNAGGKSGASFWYDLLPGCLFYSLYEYYPSETYLKDIIVESGKKWVKCVDDFGGINCDFSNATGYSVSSGQALNNGSWREPDSAAGLAYMLYGAYSVTKDDPTYKSISDQFLTRCIWCMDFLDGLTYSPFYEVLVFLAPQVAAKLNVFNGKNYDIAKYINWTLDGSSAVRGGWGMVNESWGGKHTYGLMGSLTDGNGYAFAMNTFDAVWGFVPLVKYDTRFAYSIGKWMLNVSNSARYFYPYYNSLDGVTLNDTVNGKTWSHFSGYNQSNNYFTTSDPESKFVPYEGLRRYRKSFNWTSNGSKKNFVDTSHSPYASGDSLTLWTGNTDYGLYGASHVGMLGACVYNTNVDQILKIDVNAVDFFKEDSYPTYLFYNPYNQTKTISYTKENATNRLYDSINKCFIDESSNKEVNISLSADSAYVIVEIPSNGTITSEKGNYYLGSTFISASRSSLEISLEKQDGDGYVSVSNNSVVSGNLKVSVNAQIDSATELDSFTVTIGSKVVYSGTSLLTEPVIVDTASLRSGNSIVSVIMKLANGGLEKKTMSITVANSRLEQAVSYASTSDITDDFNNNISYWNSTEIAKNIPFDCTVQTTDKGTKITGPSKLTYGSAFTTYHKVDISRNPMLKFNVKEVSSGWAVKIYVKGGNNTGYYLIRDNSETGEKVINILDCILDEDRSFDMEGIQELSVWFLPTGNNSCYLTISDLEIYYLYDVPVVEEPSKYEWEFSFTPGYLNLWTNDPSEGGANYADIEYTSDALEKFSTASGEENGQVASPYIYTDFSKNPMIQITPAYVTGTYSIGVLFDGDDTVYKLQENIPNTNTQTVSIVQKMKDLYPDDVKSGIGNVKIVIVLEDENSSVTISKVRTYYQLTLWGTTVSSVMFDEWVPNAVNSTNGKIAATSNSYNDYRITNTDASNYLTTLRGAAGKFEIDLDKNPVLSVSVAQSQGKWGVSLVFFGDLTTRYDVIEFKEGKNTQRTVNIMEKLLEIDPNFKRTGVQSVYVEVNVIGGGNYCDLRKVTTTYKQVEPNFANGSILSGVDITSWEADGALNTLSYINKQSNAVLKENLKNSAKITTPKVSIDLSRNPYIVVSPDSVSGAYRVLLNIGQESYDLSPKKGYTSSDINKIDIVAYLKGLGYTNFQTVKATISFVVEGADSEIIFTNVRFCYVLESVKNINVTDSIVTFDNIENATSYFVTIKDQNGNQLEQTEITTNSLDLTPYNLVDGIYKVEIMPYSSIMMSPDATTKGFMIGDVESVKLGSVSNVIYSGMNVTFDNVENSSYYHIVLTDVDTKAVLFDGDIYENEFNIIKYFTGANYEMKIEAVGDGLIYLNGDTKTYSFATPTTQRYTPKVLESFLASNNNCYIMVNEEGSAVVKLPEGGNWGNASSSAFTVNFDNNPVWFIDIKEMNFGYYLQVSVDGTLCYLTDNVFSAEPVYIDIVNTLRTRGEYTGSLTGNHTVKVYLGVTCGEAQYTDPYCVIASSKVFTFVDGYVDLIIGDLDSPVLKVNGTNIEWNSVEHASKYYITVSNEFGVIYTGTTPDNYYDVSYIQREGTYTIKVYASGANYYDSEISSVDYVFTAEVPQKESKGCGSSISVMLASTLSLLGFACYLFKKKED